MSRGILKLFSLGLMFLATITFAAVPELDFDFIKKGKSLDDNNTLLIIGGISGDEPGSFIAASLLATEYKITKGKVWIIPNINFPSIIMRHRGYYGDMNRKFAEIKESDPDYKYVVEVKSLINDPSVGLILNLHDGSGFYREKYINNDFNPNRWGNSAIIDQSTIDCEKYGNLEKIANKTIKSINKNLLDKDHRYHLKNTQTKNGDKEMLKALTFYAISQGKPAIANEASKILSVNQRTYYHLLALESYMETMGIEFQRDFELNLKDINNIINNKISISLEDKKISYSLSSPRKIIKYVPMPKSKEIKYQTNNPLMALVKDGNAYRVHYGNRFLTKLIPQYFDFEDLEKNVKMNIDGKEVEVALGSVVKVKKHFYVEKEDDIRVNVIGYTNKKHKNESGFIIRENQIVKSFSIDRAGKIFRVEFYITKNKEDSFAGMVLVDFSNGNSEGLTLEQLEFTRFTE